MQEQARQIDEEKRRKAMEIIKEATKYLGIAHDEYQICGIHTPRFKVIKENAEKAIRLLEEGIRLLEEAGDYEEARWRRTVALEYAKFLYDQGSRGVC